MDKGSNRELRNPRLVMAMRAVNSQNTESARSRLGEALMEARLLSPVRQQTVLTENTGPSTRIKFEEIQDTKGDSYYMAFTDMGEYNKWNVDGEHDKALLMTMEDFGNILIRTVNDLKGFVIDPYGENIAISKEVLLSLLKQKQTRQAQANRAN